jgi:NAD(P)-dependent dehydrogenase (short-subunit alcohol dehydrogenase family)
MASCIDRKYGDRGIHVFSVMPGGIWTGLQTSLPGGMVEQWKSDGEFQKGWKSAEQGAATTVWACVGKEVEGEE